jgi:hypothetical protein
MQYRRLGVYGPRPHPRPWFEDLPRWLFWGDLWSKALESVCCGGPPKFLFQVSNGLQPSELMLCTGFG